MFLHFCLTFHDRPRWLARRGSWLLLYLPSARLIALGGGCGRRNAALPTPLLEVRWFLDRLTLGFRMLLYFTGAAALGVRFRACRGSRSCAGS